MIENILFYVRNWGCFLLIESENSDKFLWESDEIEYILFDGKLVMIELLNVFIRLNFKFNLLRWLR